MLKDSLWERFGLRLPKGAKEPQRFCAYYRDVTPDQLKQSNYPDQYLTGYSLFVTDQINNRMRINISNIGKWGTEMVEEPTLSLQWSGREEESPDSQLLQFVSTMTNLNNVLKEKADITEWVLEASNDLNMEATVRLKAHTPRIFSTKDSMASFVTDSLPRLNLMLDDWYCAYLSGMTMEELLACNFPKETWPSEVSDQKTFEYIKLK